MECITKYKLSDAKRQRRLRHFNSVSTPEDLSAELNTAKLLYEESLRENNMGLSNALLGTLAKLSQSQVKLKRQQGEFFSRATVARVLEDAVAVLGDVVRDRFPGWQEALDRAADEIASNVATTRNEDAQ